MDATQTVNFEHPVKQQVFLFAVKWHGDQVRKYTGEPYWQHLLNVSNILNQHFPDHIGYFTIAMLHDVLEDTECSKGELWDFIASLGFDAGLVNAVYDSVLALTDKYTKEAYPKMNREKRKMSEAERLGYCSAMVQNVKFADLLDNMDSIIDHNLDFAVVYVKEVKYLVQRMNHRHTDLLVKLCHDLHIAEKIVEMYLENKAVQKADE